MRIDQKMFIPEIEMLVARRREIQQIWIADDKELLGSSVQVLRSILPEQYYRLIDIVVPSSFVRNITVQQLQNLFMNGISRDVVRSAFKKVLLGDPTYIEEMRLMSRPLKRVLESIAGDGTVAEAAWQYLCGQRVSKEMSEALLLLGTQLSDPEEMVDVMDAVTRTIWDAEGRVVQFVVWKSDSIAMSAAKDSNIRAYVRAIKKHSRSYIAGYIFMLQDGSAFRHDSLAAGKTQIVYFHKDK